MLAFGEVQTGLLQHSAAMSRRSVRAVLAFGPDDVVHSIERPIARSVSADRLEGVDCKLPSTTGRQTRGIGTVVSRAVVVGGHVAQGSAFAYTAKARKSRRHPSWSHYLASPGQIEAIGKLDDKDVENGVLTGLHQAEAVEMQAIAGRMLDLVQRSRSLDNLPPVLAQRTRLRWTAELDKDISTISATFTLVSDELRTVRLRVPDDDLEAVVTLCGDLALHDWLLSTVTAHLTSALAFSRDPEIRSARLRPIVEHLLHLWMPAAHVPDHLVPIWAALDRRPGFTPQWAATTTRIRDQIALAGLAHRQPPASSNGHAEQRGLSQPTRTGTAGDMGNRRAPSGQMR
ncbi:SCO2521 family protein [Actinoplanes sp. NPDC020271]|uniref:SCO2521 family protein n=1 Tax=Actinoplanes sp. NPDC020271 TaxID=3363896 RepID=UPI0037AE2A00